MAAKKTAKKSSAKKPLVSKKTQNEYLLNGLTTQPITFKAGYDMTIFKDECINRLNGLF